MKKFLVFIVFVGVSASLTWLVWFRPIKPAEEEKKPEAQVAVRVGKITRMTLRSYVTAYGVVEPEPKAGARLAVGLPGVITAVNCVEGQSVERGALLFELDNRAAEVAVRFAEKNLERQKQLADVEGTSQKLLQEAEQQLASARAQQALLQVRAPISGVLTRVNVKVGEAADLTTILAEVVDLDRLVVTANVSSAELQLLKVGQPAAVTSPGSTNAINTAVSFTSAQVDPKTDAGVARASLPAHCGLRPGQFVKLHVVSAERKDCLAVPLSSVARDNTGAAFIALLEEEKAVLKPVQSGIRDAEWVEVTGDGVEVDKTVVTEGAYGLIMTQQFATKVHVVND